MKFSRRVCRSHWWADHRHQRRCGMNAKRSTLIAVSAALVVGLVGCAPSSGAEGEDVTLIWANTGGQEAEREKTAFQDPFTEETGINIENVAFVNLTAQLQKMVEAGDPEWDIFHNVP